MAVMWVKKCFLLASSAQISVVMIPHLCVHPWRRSWPNLVSHCQQGGHFYTAVDKLSSNWAPWRTPPSQEARMQEQKDQVKQMKEEEEEQEEQEMKKN